MLIRLNFHLTRQTGTQNLNKCHLIENFVECILNELIPNNEYFQKKGAYIAVQIVKFLNHVPIH